MNTIMQARYILTILCCFSILSGCASKSSSIDISKATLENPLQIPLDAHGLKVYITSKNSTHATEDIDGLLLALLQSEYGMHMADTKNDANYIIELEVESFANIGTVDTPIDVVDVALPALVGAGTGAQIGSSIDGGEGALIGAGIGAATGIGIGLLSSGAEQNVWQMIVNININDKADESFTTRIHAQSQGEDMSAQEAAHALENEVAWTIVRAFKKHY